MEERETPATDAAGGRKDEDPLLRRPAPPAPASGPEEEAEDCGGLWELPVELSARRPECGRCGRPEKVCLCPFLPVHPLKVSTCLYIIQHPAEESRVLRTVPLLAACLPEEKCKVLIGRRFSEDRRRMKAPGELPWREHSTDGEPLQRRPVLVLPPSGPLEEEANKEGPQKMISGYPELASVCRNKNTLILYPGAGAANLEEVDLSSPDPYVIIIIDGTWSQAKDIFFKNTLFRIPKQVQLRTSLSSQYVIRTQPTNTCLSTLECAAISLAIMEKNDGIKEKSLCSLRSQAKWTSGRPSCNSLPGHTWEGRRNPGSCFMCSRDHVH